MRHSASDSLVCLLGDPRFKTQFKAEAVICELAKFLLVWRPVENRRADYIDQLDSATQPCREKRPQLRVYRQPCNLRELQTLLVEILVYDNLGSSDGNDGRNAKHGTFDFILGPHERLRFIMEKRMSK